MRLERISVIFCSEERAKLEELGIEVSDESTMDDRGIMYINPQNVIYIHNEHPRGLPLIQFTDGGYVFFDGDIDTLLEIIR